MTSSRATLSDDSNSAACACGLTFAGPWSLIGHFLAVYPPDVGQPLDDARHADVTRLAVKLAEGPTEAWDFTPWSLDPRKYRRVAASIAMRAATGELREHEEVSYQKIRDAYHATTYVARSAIAALKERGLVDNWGGRINVASRDWVQLRDSGRRDARVSGLIAAHVRTLKQKYQR